MKAALADIKVGERALTPLEKGRLYKVHRQVASMSANAAPPVVLPTPTKSSPSPAPVSVKHEFSEVLDQIGDNVYEELNLDKVAELRNNYLRVTGGDPPRTPRGLRRSSWRP